MENQRLIENQKIGNFNYHNLILNDYLPYHGRVWPARIIVCSRIIKFKLERFSFIENLRVKGI